MPLTQGKEAGCFPKVASLFHFPVRAYSGTGKENNPAAKWKLPGKGKAQI
jgi:hypothetical protein